MELTLKDLDESYIGKSIRVLYTQLEGELDDFDLEYEDEVKIVLDGESFYLPRDYPFAESIDVAEYDPIVLLGVVDPWSPFQDL